jgi:hypothetical protein
MGQAGRGEPLNNEVREIGEFFSFFSLLLFPACRPAGGLTGRGIVL